MSDRYKRFAKLGFDDFRQMASDESLSQYEKIGFPDEYRKDKELFIFEDIKRKIPALSQNEKVILDVGSGCSDIAHYLIGHCESHAHQLVMIDCKEMLDQLPDSERVRKEAAYFPDCPELLSELEGQVDAIICYSVFHYIFEESNSWNFLDQSLSLLSPGGQFLIGDIPNISKRKRFFASDTGVAFHKSFMQTDSYPEVNFNQIECHSIDDAVILAIIMRARAAGFDAYIVPQNVALPMANRREDILIVRP